MDRETKEAISCDRAYIAGMQEGFNLGVFERHEELLKRIEKIRREIAEAKKE